MALAAAGAGDAEKTLKRIARGDGGTATIKWIRQGFFDLYGVHVPAFQRWTTRVHDSTRHPAIRSTSRTCRQSQ